jgi:acetolactate synthase-1/3 small subunit
MSTVTFELKVRDQPGVLVRIAHTFARRGYNIRKLHVEPNPDSQWSTMTIVTATAPRIEDLAVHLEKLVDVDQVTVRT